MGSSVLQRDSAQRANHSATALNGQPTARQRSTSSPQRDSVYFKPFCATARQRSTGTLCYSATALNGQSVLQRDLGCLICRYTDPATDSVAVHGSLDNKVRYNLLLYGPRSYTYIALVTSIRLSLHAILLQLIRLPGNIRLISLHGNNPVVTPYLVTG